MKNLVLISALAAGLTAASPSNAQAARLSAGVIFGNGHADGYLIFSDHSYDRGRYCDSWRHAHRRLHRRFDHVRLRRRVNNRRGHKVFIARARDYRGRTVQVRYNACTGRIRVSGFGRHHRRRGHHWRGRCQSWRYVHGKLHRRYDDVQLHRRYRNRRGDQIYVAHVRDHHGRPLRVRYNACLGRITRLRPERHHNRPY